MYCPELLNKHIILRTAKITPKKVGQFVTLWKRISGGPIMPFDETDPFDYCVINVQFGNQSGQFIFSRLLFYSKGILSKNGKDYHVYPPWDVTVNAQAKKTQLWQSSHFYYNASFSN